MKRNMTLTTFATLLILVFLFSNAFAFRCGNGLVTTGDSKTKVLVTCGKPTSKEFKCKDQWTNKKTKCAEKIEVWYYNCGDNDFIYALSFENNTLTSENTEGRGNGKSDCRGK